MNKNKLIFTTLILTLILLIFTIKPAKAWGPLTHIYITEQALTQAEARGGSDLVRIIRNNWDWFKCGLMFPDVTVIYYYSQWKSYQATHSWQRQSQMWDTAVKANSDRAKAFALGVGCHLLQDSIVHNYYIPNKIKVTLVQNNIIHPLTEGIVETKIVEIDWAIEDRAVDSFTMWNRKFDDGTTLADKTPVEFASEIIGETIPWKELSQTFNDLFLQGRFGTLSFKGYSFQEQTGPLWDFYKGVASIFKYAMSGEDPKPYLEQTISVTVNWLLSNEGGNPQNYVSNLDPTGNEQLKSADSYTGSITTLTLVLVCIVFVFYYYRKYRRQKE